MELKLQLLLENRIDTREILFPGFQNKKEVLKLIGKVKQRAIMRLETFGYEFDRTDKKELFTLDFSMDKNKHYILNQTNLSEIPRELQEIWIDRTVADFLQAKWSTNTLNIETIDFSPIVNRIQEGDTTIDIATGKDGGITEEDRFLTLLDILRQPDFSYARFRRFEW